MFLQYDGKEVLNFAHKLNNVHRSALPNAVRFTLSDAAFEVKKTTLQQEAQDSFINRRPSFFKKFSGVQKATGWNIRNMEASVGMLIDPGTQATQDIEVQETGGSITRKQIMLPGARVSKSGNKPVSSKYKAIGGFKDRTAVTKKDYVKGAFAAENKKKPDHLRYKSDSGKGYIIEVSKITRTKERLKIKSKVLASFDPDRKLHINATPFVQRASMKTANRLTGLFKKNAIHQLRKYK
jgi:hypothetical protein